MITFQNETRRIIFNEGDAKPLWVDGGGEMKTFPLWKPGIHVQPVKQANESLIEASMAASVRAPQITYGVDYCQLSCVYCLNDYDTQNGAFALSKYGSRIESLTRLCEWIAESSEFSLGWAVGEPLSKPGLAFLERFQHALSLEARAKCYNAGLHTNGVMLATDPFPEHLYTGYRRRSVYWTVSLLSENEESHRSIDKHFDFLMACARNYRAKGWFRGIRIILPCETPLSDLPKGLVEQSFRFLEEAQPDTVEPFYLVRLTRDDADIRHHVFHPNCRDYLWRMYENSSVMYGMSPRVHATLVDKKTLSLYDKIIQTNKPTEFLLTDLNQVVNTGELPKMPYREYATKNLEELMAGAVNPLCLECAGLPYCTVFQRPDLHYTMGWGRTAHKQYEDTLLNMMYLYGLIRLDRASRPCNSEFYTGEPLIMAKHVLKFPRNPVALAEAIQKTWPEEFVTVDEKGIYISDSLYAMRLDNAVLNFPGYEVQGQPEVGSEAVYLTLRRTAEIPA